MILFCTCFVELELEIDQCRYDRPVFEHSFKILLGYLRLYPLEKSWQMKLYKFIVQIDHML